jgi:hypothetical protein
VVAGTETLSADFATDPAGTGVFRTMKRMKLLPMLGMLGCLGLVMPTMRAQSAAADPAAAQTVNGHREFILLPPEGTEGDLGAPQMEQR